MLVIQLEVTDVAGAVVVIHNFPRESELGAAFGGLEIANVLVLGIYRNARKGAYRLPPNSIIITQVATELVSYVHVSDPESSIAKIRIAIFRKLASSVQKGG